MVKWGDVCHQPTIELIHSRETQILRVCVDKEFKLRAKDRMQNKLFGKFLAKALPMDQVQEALKRLWGFYLIRCSSLEMLEAILFKDPLDSFWYGISAY